MSAAAPAILVETLPFLDASIAPLPAAGTVQDLVHELRQPLSSIEAIAYYLEMTLPAEQSQARQYMRRIQQLVDEAGVTLNSAVSPLRKPCGTATV